MIKKIPKQNTAFLEYLIHIIQDYVTTHIRYDKLVRVHAFLVEKVFNGRYVSMKDIVRIILYNITYRQYSDYSVILINPNEYMYGTRAKIIDVARTITYGNLFVKGNSIFNEAFDYVSDYLDQLRDEFENGGI